MKDELLIYQGEQGEILLKNDTNNQTIWANRMQMAEIFAVNPQAIGKHIARIYKEGELIKSATSSKMELVQDESGRLVTRHVDYYNLEVLISVGYRISSLKGTKFRQRATQILKQHITQGFTVNPDRIKHNHQAFLTAIDDMKSLINNNSAITSDEILELIKSFSPTRFSLDHFDKAIFPQPSDQQQVSLTANQLMDDILRLKDELMKQGEASELFAQEKKQGNLQGIVGNVFQSVFGEDAYPSIEQKAAHLLYFVVKNHPFDDGNKRSGAFAFVWFLQKVGYAFMYTINPQTLATLTILIAQSDPKEKDKMIGLVLLLLIGKPG